MPLFALTLITGWTADRIDRRVIARLTIGLETFCAATLAWLAWTGTTTLPALFAIAALLGVARAFAAPALSALAPNLVPRELLPRAIALSSIAWQSGKRSPARRWAATSTPGHRKCPIWSAACLFLISLVCLILIGPIPRTTMDATRNPWRQMVDGLGYVRQKPARARRHFAGLFAVLLGRRHGDVCRSMPATSLHAGPTGLGHLRAAPAIGATVVAIFFSFRPLKHNVGVKMFAASACSASPPSFFGLSRWIAAVFGLPGACSDRPTCSPSMSASR